MLRALLVVAFTTSVLAIGAAAQDFPSKNITLMMPYAAGGPGDTVTRIVGQGMSKAMGRTFMVENTAGAAGTIGSLKVAQSPPDGYLLLVMHFGHAANTALYRNLRYDAVADFEPIGMIAESPMMFVGKKTLPVATFPELIAYVKANREKVTKGHAGIGSASHLCGLLFLGAIDAPVTTVAYRGTGPALNDLTGGQFDFMCDQTLNVLQPRPDQGLRGDHPAAARCGSRFTDCGGGGITRLRDHGVVRVVGAQGHTEAGDRQALGGAATVAARSRGQEPAGLGRRRYRITRAGAARRVARASEGRDRQVGAADPQGWRDGGLRA